jgi:hypothetical protein
MIRKHHHAAVALLGFCLWPLMSCAPGGGGSAL